MLNPRIRLKRMNYRQSSGGIIYTGGLADTGTSIDARTALLGPGRLTPCSRTPFSSATNPPDPETKIHGTTAGKGFHFPLGQLTFTGMEPRSTGSTFVLYHGPLLEFPGSSGSGTQANKGASKSALLGIWMMWNLRYPGFSVFSVIKCRDAFSLVWRTVFVV